MQEDDQRTVLAAAHPLALAAAGLILLNDFVLAGWAPGWLTGKAADLGWLVVAPVLIAAILALVGLPGRWARGLGLGIALAVYVCLQLWPPLGAAFNPLHVADVEDLLMLPAVLIVPLIWRGMGGGRIGKGLVAIPLLAATLLADSGRDPPQPGSWPCLEHPEWDPAEPLRVFLRPERDLAVTDSLYEGFRLVDEEGEEVSLVLAIEEGNVVRVCARDGLVADTGYTWTIGPWTEEDGNAYSLSHEALPTVRFHTLDKPGSPVRNSGECADLPVASPFSVNQSCSWWKMEQGYDTGSTW